MAKTLLKRVGNFFPKNGLIVRKPSEGTVIAYSPKHALRAVGKNPLFSRAKDLISTHYSDLKAGKEITDVETGLHIKVESTGSDKGRIKDFVVKVIHGKKEYFATLVKKEPAVQFAETHLSNISKFEAFLKKKRYKLDGFNVGLIKPNLLHETPNEYFFLTDFFNKEEVVQVCDLQNEVGEKARALLGNYFGKKSGRNAFYVPKTNTILLFDLEDY